jgi:cyclophilin family peptidyl-prolyl cis-trans isomerase
MRGHPYSSALAPDIRAFLDFKAPTAQGFGYCVFGKLTSGLDVLDAIAKVPTTTVSWYENVPATPVVILSVRRA